MDFDDQMRRYFGTADLAAIEPGALAAGVEHIVETCPGDRHGWVPSDSVVHDHDAAEHHYRALLGLFDAAPKREPRPAGRDSRMPFSRILVRTLPM